MTKLNEEQLSSELGFYKFKDKYLAYDDDTYVKGAYLDEVSDQYLIFVRSANLNIMGRSQFEEMLVKSGIHIVQYDRNWLAGWHIIDYTR